MSNPNPKNITESVKAKLLNIARKEERPYQEILQFYGMERFLYRLSKAGYKNRFILKGALLFKVWEILESRTSLDIDTLAKTSNSLDYLIQIVTVIAEKLQTIVEKGFINSRIKDFYDIWLLLRWPNFKFEDLQTAIHRTFENRKTKFDFDELTTFAKEFSGKPDKVELWQRFFEKQTEVIHPFNSLGEMVEHMLNSLNKALLKESL